MTKTEKHSIWNRGFTCAFFANFLLCFSQNTANTLISTYASFLGAGAVLVGMVSGLYFGVAFAARPISGPVITILDKKKIMLATYAMGVVTNTAYALAGSVPMFILARVLHGLQFAFVGSLNLTIASDSLPNDRLGSGIGVFGIGTSLAQAISPSVGIAIRDWAGARWGEGAGYTAVFLTAAFVMLLALIPCILIPAGKPTAEERAALGKWYRNILAKETIPGALLLCLVSVSSILYTTYMVPYAAERGVAGIGAFFTVYSLVLVGARPLFGRLSDRLGTDKVLLPGLAIFALSFLTVSQGRSLAAMLAGAVLGALGFGALNPIIQTLCIRTVPPERRGVASNTEYFGMDLGYFLGPMLGGLLYNAFGSYSSVFLIGGIVPLAATFLLFILIWGKLKNRLY
ncbi:MAG: MFS transporter [Oscillospiraceae bacterium]|nr:MFS transporter [Oscillospiraceae bacterium]